MAEMTERRLEELLRASLHAEAASLPMTVTVDDTLGRARIRRTARARQGLRLLGLAALLPLAIGTAVVLAQPTRPAPLGRTIEPTGPLIEVRESHASTLLADGRVLLSGGSDRGGRALASAELFDPATSTFSATGGMTTQRSSHTATLLADGRVLVVGSDSADLYDPATGTFAPTGAPLASRSGYAAIRLDDGRVLIAGGAHSGSDPLRAPTPDAELYDPATGTFAAAPFAGHLDGRHFTSMARLPDGSILLVGGRRSRSEPGNHLGDVMLIDPAAETMRTLGRVAGGPYSWSVLGDVVGVTVVPDGRAIVLASDDLGAWGLSIVDLDDGSIAQRGSHFSMALPGDIHGFPTSAPVTLADGSILVLLDVDPDGGTSSGAEEDGLGRQVEALIVDPDSRAIEVIGSLSEIGGALVTPLADGGALVSGGWSHFGDPIPDVAHRIRP